MRVRRSTIRPRIACARWLALFVVLAANRAAAQSLSISGPLASGLRVNTATAGSAPNQDTDNTTSYTVKTTSGNSKQITAKLSSAMPAGTTLKINLAAVTGSISSGTITLSTTSQTVVYSIDNTSNRTGAITYTLTATTAAGVVTSRSRTVTFTLIAYP